MPILQNTDYDLGSNSNSQLHTIDAGERYSRDEQQGSVLTIGEQLSSSVDVHIGVNTQVIA